MARASLRSKSKMFLSTFAWLAPFCVLLYSFFAQATSVSYHGRILRPDGSPVQDLNVLFKIEIRTPGSENCLMYAETITAPVVNGIFSLAINGSGTRTDAYSATRSFDQALTNRLAFSFNPSDCTMGSTYSPAPGDGRMISVHFLAAGMSAYESLPKQALNWAPIAIEAKNIAGYGSGNILKVDTADARTTLTTAQLVEILNLSNGTSTNVVYSSSSGGARIPSTPGNPTSPVAGSVWYDSVAHQLKYSDGTATPVIVGSSSGGGGGISQLNGLSSSSQTFGTIALTGATNPTWYSSGAVHTLVIPMAATTGVGAGLISQAQFDTFNSKLTSVLPSGNLFIGNSSGVATAVAPSGDVSFAANGATTLTSIRGQAVDATTPIDGQVFRWNATDKWKPSFLSMADIRSTTMPGNTIFPSMSCSSSQTLMWSSLTDSFTCTNISVSTSQMFGSGVTAGLVFAGPATGVGSPSFRSLVASDLPAIGGSSQWTTTGSDLYFSNKVRIGSATAPTYQLDISGSANLSGSLLIGGTNGIAYPNLGSIAVGESAAATVTTGSANTSVGYLSLNALSSGGENSALGRRALQSLTNGFKNTAVGSLALQGNTSGSNSTAVGQEAAANNNADNNTAIGRSAMYANGAGTRNVVVGQRAYFWPSGGSDNVAVGNEALVGSANVANSNNTVIGSSAGASVTTGSGNTLIGRLAGSNLTTGSSNIIIGANVVAASATTVNQLNLGDLVFGDLSNKLVGIGSSTPQGALDIFGTSATTSALIIPRSDLFSRPAGVNGMIRYNISSQKFEAFGNSAWAEFAMSGSGGSSGVASQWSTAGSDIYYLTGKVGIGTASPTNLLEVGGVARFNSPTLESVGQYATIDGSATSLTVSSTAGYPPTGTLWLESEAITYTGIAGATFTGLTRGAYGTTPTSHSVATARLATFDVSSAGKSLMSMLNDGSFQVAGGAASGGQAIAIGGGARATNQNAVAAGLFSTAAGQYSVAVGYGAQSYGGGSAAFGPLSRVNAANSTALGYGVHAESYKETVVGSNNAYGGENANGWIATDPIFRVGNGDAVASTALTVLKNGSVGIGTMAPTAILELVGTTSANSAIVVPRAALAARPSGVNGMIRYNTDSNKFEAFGNSAWADLAISGSGGAAATSQWSTTGSDIYYLTGKVGIGTSVPLNPLHVVGSVVGTYTETGSTAVSPAAANQTYSGFTLANVAGSGSAGAQMTLSSGGSQPGGAYIIGLRESSWLGALALGVQTGSSSWKEGLRINSSGNVGIGTSTISYPLTVNGKGNMSGGLGVCSTVNYNVNSGLTLGGCSSGYARMEFDASIGAGSALASSTDTFNGSNKISSIATYTGSSLDSASLIISTAGSGAAGTVTERMRIDENGKVGIGTAAPKYPLDLIGTLRVGPGADAGIDMYYSGAGYLQAYDHAGFNYKKMTIDSSELVLNPSTSGHVGIGTTGTVAGAMLEVRGLGAANSSMIVPRDSTGNRPTVGVNGMIRYNTDSNVFEGFAGNIWSPLITSVSNSAFVEDASFSLKAGSNALANNSNNSTYNIALGTSAQQYMRPAAGVGSNISFGYQALQGSATPASNTGTNNFAAGYQALSSVTTATDSIAIGYQALKSMPDNNSNMAFGNGALTNLTSGGGNIAMGTGALSAETNNNYNVAVGWQAMNGGTGGNSAAIGKSALNNNSGYYNYGFGEDTMKAVTGNGNIAIGFAAGNAGTPLTSGSNSVFIGYQAQTSLATTANAVAIGNAAIVQGNNAVAIGNGTVAAANNVVIGNASTTQTLLGGNVGIGTATAGTKLDVNGGIRAGSNTVVTACTAADEGTQRYNYTKHAIEWCNGSGWITAGSVGGTTPLPTGMGGTGYFVLSNSSWDGNLGGLVGADAKCRTELSTYNWMGKPGSLDTSKVYAWLCDGSACNTLIASTNYYYATANDLTAGGAFFTTDTLMRGPGDGFQWNALNRFNVTASYFSNHFPSSNTQWENYPHSSGSVASNCSNWSTNSSGSIGNTNGTTTASNDTRFSYLSTNCGIPSRLICFVNP
jgi:hypothetical protein